MLNNSMATIYAIKNVVNNKIYIGSTKSFKSRKYCHFYQLKKGIHHSQHLQKSYNKYGKDKFSCYVIEECDDSIRVNREIFFIDQYKSHIRDYGYNIIEPDSNKFKKSQESKDKASNSYPKKIKIDLYSVDGTFIKTFISLISCCRFFNRGQQQTHIFSDILKGKRKSYKGHTVVIHGEPFKYEKSSKQRDMSKYCKD